MGIQCGRLCLRTKDSMKDSMEGVGLAKKARPQMVKRASGLISEITLLRLDLTPFMDLVNLS